MPFALAAWLPSLIMGGGSVLGALFGSRAQGKAAKESSDASERSAEMQLQFGREQLQNLREIYNLDLKSLQWPTHRLAGESLGQSSARHGQQAGSQCLRHLRGPPGTSDAFSRADRAEPVARGVRSEISPGDTRCQEEGEGGPSKGWGSPGRIAGAFLGGVGGYLLGGKIGRGRREADYLVPHQEELTRRIGADRIRSRQPNSRRDDDGRGLGRRVQRRAVHEGSLLRVHATLRARRTRRAALTSAAGSILS